MGVIKIEQEKSKVIWAAITKSISVHSVFRPDPKTLKPDMETKKLFPTTNGVDEHANRLGYVMFNLFDYFNKKFNLKLKIDYRPREEFEKFPDLESIYRYWVDRIDRME